MPKPFKRKSNLNNHLKTHVSEYKFPCLICLKRFNQKSHLIEHMNVHLNEKNHHCFLCEKSFKYKRSLLEHKRIHNKKNIEGKAVRSSSISGDNFQFSSVILPKVA